jgi:hypothetical protein
MNPFLHVDLISLNPQAGLALAFSDGSIDPNRPNDQCFACVLVTDKTKDLA